LGGIAIPPFLIMIKELDELKNKCNECKSCELHKTRNNIVFADGNPETASIVLIGEAPGENEDLQGIPFVGRAGKLLNEFLIKAGLSRENDLYIINTVKCRPFIQGNDNKRKDRAPTNEEKEACKHFLIEQINIINPNLILLCGRTAMNEFLTNLKTKDTITKIRGTIYEIELNGKKYQAMPIVHPSWLGRQHSTKPDSPRVFFLQDLKKARGFIN